MIFGILILLVFLVFAVLMYRRLLPAILAVPLMAVLMALAAGCSLPQIGTQVVIAGSTALAGAYVTVIFGAWLARVTLDTGIARALVNLAAEYGGESPFWLALVLCAVVALLFTSLTGLGAIIMVGSIALPIMMTTGVPRTVAATLFLMSFALGFIFNVANWKFYTTLFGVEPQQLGTYALLLATIDAVALIVYAVWAFRRERAYATWAVRAARDERPGVPAIALITPVLPIILYFVLCLDAIIAFSLSAAFGALVTRPKKLVPTIVAAAIRGLEDVAPAVLLFIGIGMLLAATKTPQFAQALQPIAAAGWASNPIAFIVLFGLLSPLTLYRGPLNPFGVGIAIFTVLLASHALPPVILVAAVMAVVQVQNVCDPTNTANVWVANFTGVPIDTITKRTLPFQVAVATLATILVVTMWWPAFHEHVFAQAAPGLYADATASNKVAIDTDGSAFAKGAASAVIADLTHPPLAPFAFHGNPNAADCSGKPYAAYVLISSSTFALIEGTDLDVGLRLQDCGGWIVNEWHDHRVVPHATQADADALAHEGTARVLAWEQSDPNAAAVFRRGLAPSKQPSYYFTMFKTVDGQMRVYVRAGGPAYVAGLRTNDIVDKLDGKFWWEYGTYQTQARAFDGKPHSFEVERGDQKIDITLGAPI